MRSLERRLRLSLAISLILLIGILWIMGNQSVRALTEDFVVSRMQHDTENLLAALTLDPGHVRVRQGRISHVYHQPLSGHYYIFRFPNGDKLGSRSLWDNSLDVPQLSPGETRRLQLHGPSGQRLLVLAQGFQKKGQIFTLAVAEDLSLVKERRDRFKRNFALLALGGLLLLLLLQSVVVRRSFRLLEPLREEVRQLELGKTGKLSEDVPSEILPLVREINHLLQLFTQRLERSRNALGNLAHALKGPLSLLTGHFDQQVHGKEGLSPNEAKAQTDRIRQLMERELKRARLAGKGLQSQRFDPVVELPNLIGVLQQIYLDRSLEINFNLDGSVQPFGDSEDMLELLGALLDNACKWAASRVHCSIKVGGGINILVEDDGAGISDEALRRIGERGVRLDESVEGDGLGLAIVRDIVNLYGGSIVFGRSSGFGGLQVEVRLPWTESV